MWSDTEETNEDDEILYEIVTRFYVPDDRDGNDEVNSVVGPAPLIETLKTFESRIQTHGTVADV